MTQQFKFGDIVRDASLGVCVVINTSEHFAYIMNSRGNYNTLANPADLELIPHPDTARLDWLADPANKGGALIQAVKDSEDVIRHCDNGTGFSCFNWTKHFKRAANLIVLMKQEDLLLKA